LRIKKEVKMNGQKLRDMRKARDKTLRQVSVESGVTETQIRNIETGVTENPSIATLVSLAKALSCEITDFLD
jgi:transcriptional regulator with XRE-family HTH domain